MRKNDLIKNKYNMDCKTVISPQIIPETNKINGLDNGFIMEGTVNQSNENEESQDIKLEISNLKKKEEERTFKLSQKVENMKQNYNPFLTGNTVITSNSYITK